MEILPASQPSLGRSLTCLSSHLAAAKIVLLALCVFYVLEPRAFYSILKSPLMSVRALNEIDM